MSEMTDLSDIKLPPTLVTEDSSKWILPSTMSRYDSIMDWWQDLADGNIHRRVQIATKERLLWLANLYEQLKSEAYDGLNTVPHLSKIRAVLRQICQHGLDPEQVGRFLSITPEQVIGELYCNRQLYPSDITIRLQAERSLRGGATIREVVESTGLTRDQVETLAEIFGLTVASPKPNAFPQDVRERAVEMRLGGMTNKEISDALMEEGIVVKPATIARWWIRYNERKQKEN